jgi:ferritin-like metal-binding protein YciE
MESDTIEKLYIYELEELYNAERQYLDLLPELSRAAASPMLKDAFERDAFETREHIERLEIIFDQRQLCPRRKTCLGMDGIVQKVRERIEEGGDPDVLDAALIAAAQRMEHYEIASYGCVQAYADVLGFKREATLLKTILREENATDISLTALAESLINLEAAEVG